MRGIQIFEAILGRHRRIAALILAAAMIVSVPIGAFLVLDGLDETTSSSPASEEAASSSIAEAPPANLDLVRESLRQAAEAHGVDYEPEPLPEPPTRRPLHQALDVWLETRFDDVPPGVERSAHEQASDVPHDLREPLAQLLLAHARATELQREALEELGEAERDRIRSFAADRAALSATLADPPAWLSDVAEKVNLQHSFRATHLLVDAADASMPELQDHAQAIARSASAPERDEATERDMTPAVLEAARDSPASDLDDLDVLLETLAGPRPSVQPPAAAPLSEQLGDHTAASGPAAVHELPESLDHALGRLWLASTASSDLLAAHGPDALLEAHLLRVRTMQETQPTLDAWGTALETSSADERHLARPSLAAGQALERAAQLPADDPGASQLLAFGLHGPQASTSSSSPAPASDPVDALGALYAASDADPPSDWRPRTSMTLSTLEDDRRQGLVLLLQGLAEAQRRAEAALDDLSHEERRFLLDHRDELNAFLAGDELRGQELASAARALRLAQRVDDAQLADAALTATDAIDRAQPLLLPAQAHDGADPGSQAPRDCPKDAPLSRCEDGVLFADPAGLVVVGTAQDSTHREPDDNAPILLLDLGGNDTYKAPVADAHLLRPLSVGLDLGGEDSYETSATGQGRGLGGVGLLVQAAGDTTYRTSQRGQAYGGVGGGIGALLDLGGDDSYHAQALSQAAVQPLDHGAAVLVDAEGNDHYTSSRGIAYSAGSTFVDMNGEDIYEPKEAAHGARLDQGVDLDDVPERVFEDRRDNALWMDGTFTLDTGFGLDVDAGDLDHDDDRFPSLVELLANSDANSGAQTPVDQAEDVAEASEDTDGDGSPDAVEEAAGTDPDDPAEGSTALPGNLPLAPQQARELYQQLREEHSEKPPPNGLLLDIRMPLEDRSGYECPSDQLFVCVDLDGPGDGTSRTEARAGGSIGATASDVGLTLNTLQTTRLEAEAEGELGLVALGASTNSTFELPYLLSVDLGGDDTYEHGAGGAIEVATSHARSGAGPTDGERDDRNAIPTLHLDLGGSDDYRGEFMAQGAGGGVLADLGHGDDSYVGGRSTQGARGGLLFDEAGDDVYEAGADSQGAAVPTFGFQGVIPVGNDVVTKMVGVVHESLETPMVRPSLVVDAGGDDRWEAAENAQGYAGLTPGNATLDTQRTAVNEGLLVGGLVDRAGEDTYRAGERAQATTATSGIALLADRSGDDTYRAGGLVSQAGLDTRTISNGTSSTSRLPGLSLLLDSSGSDTYEVHAVETDNRSRTDQREGNITRKQMDLGEDGSELSLGGVRLAAMQAVHADLEASDRDSDDDGWHDLLEILTGTREDEQASRPVGTDAERDRLLDLPTAGLVVGGADDDTYQRDRILAIDIGGSNTYTNNAGGPLLDPLATEVESEESTGGVSTEDSDRTGLAVRDVILFEHPVAAVFDAGSEGSTFRAPGHLSQASSLFTVGLVMTTGGDNTFDAGSEPRETTIAPEGPRASLDGLVGVKEYRYEEDVTWLPEIDPARERQGQLGLVHDGSQLYLGGSIRDEDPGRDDDADPRLDVYLARNHTPPLLERWQLTFGGEGGTLDDQHWNPDEEAWLDDDLRDDTPTRVRADYANGAWTFEIARPMEEPTRLEFSGYDSTDQALVLELCQPARVLDEGPFNETSVLDEGRRLNLSDPFFNGREKFKIELQPEGDQLTFEEWYWIDDRGNRATSETVDEGCEPFLDEGSEPQDEDVRIVPGEFTQFSLTFHDPTTDETWRYPPRATVEDGDGPFPADGDRAGELRTWIPLFPDTPDRNPPRLTEGPRVTQGASLAGVSLLTSVSTKTGTDSYEAHRQAQGYATVRGTGLLVDLGGPDTYAIQREGQGHATRNGHGLLVDHHGNDRYQAHAKAQGHSPEPTTDAFSEFNFFNSELLDGIQAEGALLDLGGYDHYDYEDTGAKQPLVVLPEPPSSDYETHAGNDRVWTQSEGGLGVDTALTSHGVRSLLGESTLAAVDTEAWPTMDDGECPSRQPAPDERLDWHANHSIRLASEEICLAVTVEDVIVDNVPLRRVEILLDGRREIVHDVRESSPTVDHWPLSNDRTRLVFPIDTGEIPDGPATWRAIAFYDAPRPEGPAQDAAWGPAPPVIAEDATTVAISNPPSVRGLEVGAGLVSPTAAIGEPGFTFDATLSPDLSAADHELAGYGKTREQMPCPFDGNRPCDRYTLYLQDGKMKPHRPDGTVPRATASDPSDRNSSASYEHELRDDLFLPGGEAMGVVEEKDSDLWTQLADTDVSVLTGEQDAVYADRDQDGAISVGDIRLTPAGSRGPGTLVHEGDEDVGDQTRDRPEAYVARDADLDEWSPGDALYLDVDNSSDLNHVDVRLLTDQPGEPNGSLVSWPARLSLEPVQGKLELSNWTVIASDRTSTTLFVDRDNSSSVNPGDVRLGSTHIAPHGAAELAYYHKPFYEGEVNVHVSLATARDNASDRIVANQTAPTFAEAHGRVAVSPSDTPVLEPAGDEVEGWSRFWLPADDTRLYPQAPQTASPPHRFELDIRTTFDNTTRERSLESALLHTASEDPQLDPPDVEGALQALAEDTQNWTRDAANWTQDPENWTRQAENWTQDPQDWQNDTGNWTQDIQSWIRQGQNWSDDLQGWSSDAQNWIQVAQNATADAQNTTQDVQAWSSDLGNWTRDVQNWIREGENWTEDPEEWSRDAQNWTKNPQNSTQDIQNWTGDLGNWTRDVQNWIREGENWTEDPEEWSRDAENWTQVAEDRRNDADNITRDVRNWTHDVEAWTRNVQNWSNDPGDWTGDGENWSRDVENWTQDVDGWRSDVGNWSDDVDGWSQDLQAAGQDPPRWAENLTAWPEDAERWIGEIERWVGDAQIWLEDLNRWIETVDGWRQDLPDPTSASEPTRHDAEDLANRSICSSASRGVCLGLAMDGARPTPSRLHLYIPSHTEQRLRLNATSLDTEEQHVFTTEGLGGDARTYTWSAEDAEDGLYNITLSAYDQPANRTPVDEDPEDTRRWADPLQGPTIRVDRQAPTTEIALPDYVGTSLIDSFRRTFPIPWTVSDPGEVEELRVFAAPGGDDDEWELVERVHDPDKGAVDYEFDADEDRFSIVAVSMDEAGNIEGLEENFWPTRWPEGGRCPTPLPDDVTVWPHDAEEDTPDIDEHCFQNRDAAIDGAFRAALEEKGEHTVTIDRETPFIEDFQLDLSSRDGPREVRVDERPVLGLAGGEHAVPRACASDEGEAPIAQVNFFMLRTLPDGNKTEVSHALNETDGTVLDDSGDTRCYAFEDLASWTQDAELYPEGFWTAGFEVVDGAGNTAETFLGTVYVDQQAPNLTEGGIRLPEGQLAVMPGQTITVTGHVEDATGIAEARLAAPALNASDEVEVRVDEGRLAAELAIDEDVPAGAYDVYLNVTDALGNRLVQHRSVPVNMTPTEIVDGPELTHLAAAGDGGTPVSTVPGGLGLRFETSTPSRFRVLAAADGGSPSQVYLHEGNFTTQHNVTIDTLSPGQTYTIEVVAFSEGGHEAVSEPLVVQAGPSFSIDVLAPASEGMLGPDSRIEWTTEKAPNASLGDDASSLISLRRFPDASFRPVGGHTHGFNATHLDVDLQGVPSGNQYALRIQTAAAGQRDVTLVEPITVDTAAPSVSLAQPDQGWTNVTRPTIELAVHDALAGLPQAPVVEARLDGERVPTGTLTNDSRVSVNPRTSLGEGVHRLEVQIEDRLGNIAQETLALNVDRQAPTLRLLDTPQAPVAPGAEVPIEVFTSDDGRIASVEAQLGPERVPARDPGGLDEFTVPVPLDASGPQTLLLRVEDQAGNQRTEAVSLSIDDEPPTILSLDTEAAVASAEINLSADEPVRLVASAAGQLTVSSLAEDHDLTLTGLRPDQQHPVQVRITDAAGHTLHRTLAVETQPDRSPPGAPHDIRVQPRADGTIALEWDEAEDEAGIAFYRLARTTPGSPAWRSLDRTLDTHFVDENVEASQTYRYRVQAVDLVSKTGPPATSGDVSPLAKPELVDPQVDRVDEDRSGTYAFEVTYRHPADQAPQEVRLVLDGSLVEMEPIASEGEGTRYRATLDVDPHTPSGAHAYRFEAHTDDPPLTVRVPEHGNFTGPLVSALDEDGVPSVSPIPLGPGLAGLALLAAAMVARVRSGRAQR